MCLKLAQLTAHSGDQIKQRSEPPMKLQLPAPNLFHRAVKRFASSGFGSWFLSHTLNHVDRIVVRLTHQSLATILAGLPVLYVTTRDMSTGKPHTVPLVSVPMDDQIILIASNWGQAFHPHWYCNLSADPSVKLAYRDQAGEYTASETTGDLRATCWRKAVEVYPGFDAYQRRAGPRQIPVLLLTPKAA
jgi:deazaflavin-dependent oxidoreductase (nitroreductase family)